MYKCKICDKDLKRLSGHIKSIHGITSMEYIEEYEDIQICSLYKEGKSAQQIADIIKEVNIGLSPIKKDIIAHLRDKNVEIRNTSEAIKEWNKGNGGVWNKGESKESHRSVAKQAKSMRGKNNPYWTMSEESRQKTRYWEYKSEEETFEIRRRASETLRNRYQNGELTPYAFQNPEWEKKALKKRMEGYRRWQKSGNKVKFGNSSKAELEIADILEDLGIKYIRQFSPGKYRFDFFLPDCNLVLEYNGSYWHADPSIYKPDDYIVKKGKMASEIWEYDKEKIKYIEEKGFLIRIIWENIFKTKTKQQKGELIYEIIKSKTSETFEK